MALHFVVDQEFGRARRTDRSGTVLPTVLTPRRTPRRLVAAVLAMATLAACSPDIEPSADLRAPPTSTGTSSRLRPADEPCANGRADEQGAPTPADDIYVGEEVLAWPLAAPAEQKFDAMGLESVVHDVGLSSTVLSLLVARRGELVVEEYFNGGDASHAHNIFSTTKLLTVLAIGAAANDGIVPGLDTTLGDWVDEIAGPRAGSVDMSTSGSSIRSASRSTTGTRRPMAT
jgi:CubicO group peptidase (beta-lactamase class C family)